MNEHVYDGDAISDSEWATAEDLDPDDDADTMTDSELLRALADSLEGDEWEHPLQAELANKHD